MELSYLFRVLYKRKWIILASVLLAVLAAFFLTQNTKPQYKSIAQLSTGFTVTEDIKLSEDNFNISQIDVKFNNTIENITSQKVLSQISYLLIIHDLNSKKPFRTLDKKEKAVLGEINTSELLNQYLGKLDSLHVLNPSIPIENKMIQLLKAYKYDLESILKDLSVVRFQRTDYINISFKSENPELSAFVVNNLISEFERYFKTFRKERSNESRSSLDSLVDKKKQELDNLVAFKSKFLNDSAASDPMLETSRQQQINQFETSLAEEIGRSQNLKYLISQLNQQIENAKSLKSTKTNINTGTNDEYVILRKQYNDLYAEYVSKGSNDPSMKSRLDNLQKQMEDKVPSAEIIPQSDNGPANNIHIDGLIQRKIEAEGQLKSAEVKIAFYQRSINQLKGLANGQGITSGSLVQIDKEIEIATTEYIEVKDKLNIALNMNEGSASNFKQTIFGQPAFKPEPSKRILVLAMSGLSAFLVSCLVLIFLQLLDSSIRTPSNFQKQSGINLLGLINWMPLKHERINVQVMNTESDTIQRSNAFRELLRKARFEIENSGKKIFLFTSTMPRQGKTTLIQAIAYSISLTHKRVLIIDTNFCNNDITVYNEALPSLESYSYIGEELNTENLNSIISKTENEFVDIIGCQGGDYTPAEILPKNHILNFLPALLKEYDFIFLEGAGLNGFTDSKELAPYADGIIVIFSAESDFKPADKDSLKFLKGLGDKFMGAILNKVDNENLNL